MNREPYLKAILTETSDIDMYRHNAYFKHALDTYIEMIPIFVDGLKEHARVEDQKYKNLAKTLRETATVTIRPSWDYEGPSGVGYTDDR